MHVFVEKEFLKNLDKEYDEIKSSESKKVLYKLFTEYANIKWFCNLDEDDFEAEIESNFILSKLSDINANNFFVKDFNNYLKTHETNFQTLVFTQKTKEWFTEYDNTNVLCFSYEDFEKKIFNFIQRTHKRLDLSGDKFNSLWFNFIGDKSNVIIISDKYILKKENSLVELLKGNLKKDIKYSVYIFFSDDLDKKKVDNKIENMYCHFEEEDIKVIISVVNLKVYNSGADFHDRLMYSNYTLSEVGVGFNSLINRKQSNSELRSNSIFDKYTYKRITRHIDLFKNYVVKLDNLETKEYKTNRGELKNEFFRLFSQF